MNRERKECEIVIEMLTDTQILHLLARCEKGTGCILPKLRHRLKQDDWLCVVWELLVADAANRIGRISYEPPTPGSARPDFLVETSAGNRLWIDATLAFEQSSKPLTELNQHRLFRKLLEKNDQARRTNTTDPVVFCIGTDRVSSLSPFHGPGEVSRDRAIYASFAQFRSISAAIVVPILIGPEILTGLVRHAEPVLFKNPEAINSLPSALEKNLQRLEFNRWPFSLQRQGRKVRQSLREALKPFHGTPIDTSCLNCDGVPPPESTFAGPNWVHYWKFQRLRIAKIGNRFWLFEGDNVLDSFPSAEDAAQHASELFQPFPVHVLTSRGVQPNSEPGVPSNLGEWTIES